MQVMEELDASDGRSNQMQVMEEPDASDLLTMQLLSGLASHS